MSAKISAEQLKRGAIVYVRQSTATQLTENRESQRRQYDLAGHARELGFARVDVIDDDLGRSGSGSVARPGFERLVGAVCAGSVGAVLCIEASRLARNGRDWHHLIELCALASAVIIDPDGVYDPRLVNDRLLLGMKGTMSEFELTLLRQRSQEAIRTKARRGELQLELATGLRWTDDRIVLDPDRRVQQAIRTVFEKFTELGSVRQVLMWLVEEQLSLPVGERGKQGVVRWQAPTYRRVLAFIRNPFYAGAYTFGRSQVLTRMEGGSVRKAQRARPMGCWSVLIQDHHPGYISWEQFLKNQRQLEENTHMHPTQSRKAGRGGSSLLAGLLRCARCGRMLQVGYQRRGYGRYLCRYENRSNGAPRCISFGNTSPDEQIAREVVRAIQPCAVEAAVAAARDLTRERCAVRDALELELAQARYESDLAARRYEAVDPAQRLVANELERRWNAALERQVAIEARLRDTASMSSPSAPVDPDKLMTLAADVQKTWDSPNASMSLKQRIVRLLIQEIVVDIDETQNELKLLIHWSGGRHSELRIARRKSGHHRHGTSPDVDSVVRDMAGRWPDAQIASTLNRLRLRTGMGNTWTVSRVLSVRRRLGLPQYDPSNPTTSDMLSLSQAATRLGVGPWVVRRLVKLGLLPASQSVLHGPWRIPVALLDDASLQAAARDIVARKRPRNERHDTGTLRIPGT
jgi:DNA invertase Pin-like site-specific DNA recombinase